MITVRVTGANFYHTHLFSIFKDPKEQKCPNTPAADLKHYILCISDTWWQQDMQLNALPCYEEPTERIWLIYPTDFHITGSPRAKQIETHFVWPQVSSGCFYTVILNVLFLLYFISPTNEKLVLFCPHYFMDGEF